MSFKKNILKKYINTEDIYYLIGHDPWKYTKIITIYVIILGFLFFLHKNISNYIQSNYINIFFGLIGIILYFKFIIKFLDIYLDSIIITKNGLTIFRWDGILKYSSENIERDSLEAINEHQNGILDIILKKGDLKIKRAEESYNFDEVSHPNKQVSTILKFREKFSTPPTETEPEEDLDKFDVLVETLGEVILDYIKKGKK